MSSIFVTGTGTGVGKTLISAILTEVLQADYWKPVQSGLVEGADTEWVKRHVSNPVSIFHPEVYRLAMPASPHLAAAAEGINISIDHIVKQKPLTRRPLVIEGAGGLLVPLNEHHLTIELIKKMKSDVIIVSKNELGSINHSLLTARVLHQYGMKSLGWIFNEVFGNYEADIVKWSGIRKIASIPYQDNLNRESVRRLANDLRSQFSFLL